MNIEHIKKLPSRKGKRELLAFMEGKRLNRRQAMLAKCYECTNGYADGLVDCNILTCPMHGYMPFSEAKYPPKRTQNRAGFGFKSKTLTPEAANPQNESPTP